ncbi:MAG: M14 family metallocarboxypeptidase [Candidatus Nitronauta litoralis]|uniref:M14 family metallocarboxypeptidase n=1 Tax=Candidatus Nitronauta litoralis TaxID=2705533 RepID=A0A7T0BYS9_9BACT|nr:MAG: M14 family metallocarboxypeptidase [Candidatus Nitronauta litoralis]
MNKAGEPLYSRVLSRLKTVLPENSQISSTLIVSGSDQYPIQHLVLGKGNSQRALISAGIHGDEPAGVEALLTFLEKKFFQKYIDDWELNIIPCINPSGYNASTRENADKIDLNRKFRDTSPPQEVVFIKSLFKRAFDLDIELHEDIDSPGYYLFQKEAEPISPLGRNILNEVSKIMPINLEEEIEELPAENGLLAHLSNPDEMEWWPMAIYAFSKGCKKVFTLETATKLPMDMRVRAHLKAIEVALDNF